MSKRKPPAGTAICDECDWTAKGPRRFHAAVEHREKTGHETAASLADGPGDDTGHRVSQALSQGSMRIRRGW